MACTSSCPPKDPTSSTLAAAVRTTAPHVQGASSSATSSSVPPDWKGKWQCVLILITEVLPLISFGSSSLSIAFSWCVSHLLLKKFKFRREKVCRSCSKTDHTNICVSRSGCITYKAQKAAPVPCPLLSGAHPCAVTIQTGTTAKMDTAPKTPWFSLSSQPSAHVTTLS